MISTEAQQGNYKMPLNNVMRIPKEDEYWTNGKLRIVRLYTQTRDRKTVSMVLYNKPTTSFVRTTLSDYFEWLEEVSV